MKTKGNKQVSTVTSLHQTEPGEIPQKSAKPARNYRDRFVRYSKAREQNRKAACRTAGEKLRAAVAGGANVRGDGSAVAGGAAR